MIDGVKKLFNVAFEDKALPVMSIDSIGNFFKPADHAMATFIVAAWIGIVNKCQFKDSIECFEYRVVHDAVPHTWFMDKTELGVADIKTMVWAMLIAFAYQVVVEIKQIVAQISLEYLNIKLFGFADLEFIPRI